jgi:hypothetical protein
MATDNDDNTGLTVAVIGGGALLVWLLWRGRGKGAGGGVREQGSARVSAPAQLMVWVLGGDRVALNTVDGMVLDLPTMVARARAMGAARVFRTGDARHGWVLDVIGALRDAGVAVDEARLEATQPRLPSSSRTPRS